jgi:hypothetical protein
MFYHTRALHVCALPLVTSLICLASTGTACDLCSLPTAPNHGGSGFSVGLHEQFSHLATIRDDGEKIANDEDQYLDSSLTQLAVSYRFQPWLSGQAVVPYIHRSYRRPEGLTETDQGIEEGIGDITLLGTARLYVRALDGDEGNVFRLDGSVGLKLPTGDSSRLKEEQNEVEIPGAPESAVHGHDLALGSGSWDVPLALDALVRWQWFSCTAHLEYTIRTEGDYDYTYANDLNWALTPGVDVWGDDTSRLILQANLTGESKGKDEANGETADDTAITAVYLGPQVALVWERNFYLEAGLDLPLVQNNSAVQVVPDYRIHGNVSWAF